MATLQITYDALNDIRSDVIAQDTVMLTLETKKGPKLSQKLIEISWRERWPTYTFACCRVSFKMGSGVGMELDSDREGKSERERGGRAKGGREWKIVVHGRQQRCKWATFPAN